MNDLFLSQDGCVVYAVSRAWYRDLRSSRQHREKTEKTTCNSTETRQVSQPHTPGPTLHHSRAHKTQRTAMKISKEGQLPMPKQCFKYCLKFNLNSTKPNQTKLISY